MPALSGRRANGLINLTHGRSSCGGEIPQADLASGTSTLKPEQRLSRRPLLLGQHNLLRQTVLGVHHYRAQQVTREPFAHLVADDKHLQMGRIGKPYSCAISSRTGT